MKPDFYKAILTVIAFATAIACTADTHAETTVNEQPPAGQPANHPVAQPHTAKAASPSVSAQSTDAKKPLEKATSLLDEEAKNAARLYWDSEFTKCGASYYTVSIHADGTVYVDAEGRLRWKKPPTMTAIQVSDEVDWDSDWMLFGEYKGASFSVLRVTSKPLSPADRLNGFEWQGWVLAPTASVNRSRAGNFEGRHLPPRWDTWWEWHDTPSEFFRVGLYKKGGQWFAADKEVRNLGRKIASCSVKSNFLPFE